MRAKRVRRLIKKRKIRNKLGGDAIRPRVSVYRSNKHSLVQVVNDVDSKVIFGCRDLSEKTDEKSNKWFKLGEKVGDRLVKNKIKTIIFDRGGYKYLGRVKDIAEGIRSKKIKF